jgi:hypothetical protein
MNASVPAGRHADFYWLSSPRAQHSRNLPERPQVQIVIFDSTADVGRGEAVYVTATARQVDARELEPSARKRSGR